MLLPLLPLDAPHECTAPQIGTELTSEEKSRLSDRLHSIAGSQMTAKFKQMLNLIDGPRRSERLSISSLVQIYEDESD